MNLTAMLFLMLLVTVALAVTDMTIDNKTWTDPTDGTVHHVCNVTSDCPKEGDICVTWTDEKSGLCSSNNSSSESCAATSDCPKHTQSCQVAKVKEGLVRGFCMPAIYYAKDPVKCEQDFSQPLPCESSLGIDDDVRANRFCHTARGVKGRCLPYHCNQHIDCGFALIDNSAFIGSCEHDRCVFEISNPLSKVTNVEEVIMDVMGHIKNYSLNKEATTTTTTRQLLRPEREL